MSEKEHCGRCDYNPDAFRSVNKCPIYCKGLRDKKPFPMGKKCEWYYSTVEDFEAANLELERKVLERDNVGK